MVEAGGDEYHSSNAMNDAPQVFAHAEHFSKPGIRKLERKAGNDQDDEAAEKNEMLPALVGGHALHHGVLHVSTRGGLAAPDDEVVQEHGADDGEDENDVEDAHPARDDRADVFGMHAVGHVHGCQGELLGSTLVTLAAGGVEVAFVDGGVRITRGQNVVDAVAA